MAVEFIRCYIVIKKWASGVVAARMKQKGIPDALCAKSIYNYIDQGWISDVTNETLWEKCIRRKQGRKTLCRKPKKCPKRRKGIEARPEEVKTRATFGHWEIDLVVGDKGTDKAALMTLVERKTRKMLIRKLTALFADSLPKAQILRISSSKRSNGFRIGSITRACPGRVSF